jgi:DNA replication and repair protein RecF
VTIRSFRAENFRCLERIEFDANPRHNLIFGANASGKTSLLEAVAYLGRGKSFRGSPATQLIRHGSQEFTLFGTVDRGTRESRIGVRNSREGLEVRVDGDGSGGVASLADALPLQVIDPEIHDLVGGGPEFRRRYLDWIAFHVEQDFLAIWRRFRRALRQRNAALRTGQGIDAWTTEFLEWGDRMDGIRRRVLGRSEDALARFSRELLGDGVGLEYRQGWPGDKTLDAALRDSRERDQLAGATHLGPHRGDLHLAYDERQARRLVSRGQQKLLACAMVLTATAVVQDVTGRRMLLLLDDPAAELDSQSLGRLLDAVFSLDCQVIATALDPGSLNFPEPPSVFHVEHGKLTPASGH